MSNFRSLVFKSLSENSGMMKDFDMLTLQEVYQFIMISIREPSFKKECFLSGNLYIFFGRLK